MTIRRGDPWGEELPVPDDLDIADSDRGVSMAVEVRRRGGREVEPMGVRDGDMARTMGGGTPGRFDGTVVRAPVDVVRVLADGREHCALAHVVVRRRWWRGRVVLAMNAQYLGAWDVAPRSHPNDGLLDVLDVSAEMGLRGRLQARSRALNGSHLPHPHIAVSRTGEWQATFPRPMQLWIDGERHGDVRELRLEVQPDALMLYA